jgi:DNA-binding NarL/FixJ family response regulator
VQPLPTILVVEDVEEVRTITRMILSQEMFNVLEAADGQKALHEIEARNGAIDLVLTDVLMPVMGGAEMAAACPGTIPRFGYSSCPATTMRLGCGFCKNTKIFLFLSRLQRLRWFRA